MKIINKQSKIGIAEEFYLSQSEGDSPEDSLSDNSEELLQRSMVFSTRFVCQNKEYQISQDLERKKKNQELSLVLCDNLEMGWVGGGGRFRRRGQVYTYD